jgi:hypothetical protein
MIMTLELEEVTDRTIEILETTVVPYHAHFVNDDQALWGESPVTDILIGDMLSTEDRFCREDVPTTGTISRSIFCQESRFATPLLAKDEDETIGVEILPG